MLRGVQVHEKPLRLVRDLLSQRPLKTQAPLGAFGLSRVLEKSDGARPEVPLGTSIDVARDRHGDLSIGQEEAELLPCVVEIDIGVTTSVGIAPLKLIAA
jgi:hypothetical protein